MTVMFDSSAPVPRRQALASLGAIALATGLGETRPTGVDAISADLSDAEIAELLRLASVPSMSLALIDGGRITTRQVGLQRVGDSATVNADTVYAAASLTKVVFAYALLSLVHEKLLSLDEPVRTYLALPNADDARARGITARHLLSHSGGWRNWRNTTSQALTADFEPGSRWSYSGEGFFFLQRVAEKLTGRSVGRLIRERVFDPLGMTRSSLAPLPELDANRAAGHDGRGQLGRVFAANAALELRRMLDARGKSVDDATVEDAEQALRTAEPALPVLPNFLVPNAAASLLTTANDFGKFLQHLVSAPARGGSAAAIVGLLLSPQIRCNERVQWGLGTGIEDAGFGPALWQWGDNPGFKNYYFAEPGRGRAMVVFTNGDRGARVYERVIRAIVGGDRPGFLWA